MHAGPNARQQTALLCHSRIVLRQPTNSRDHTAARVNVAANRPVTVTFMCLYVVNYGFFFLISIVKKT